MENKKVIIVDNSKNVKLESLNQLFGYCGTVKSIEQHETNEFNYFEVTYAEETEAACAIYMDNTLVDNTQIKVHTYTEFSILNASLKQSTNETNSMKETNTNEMKETKETDEDIDIIDLNEVDENETITIHDTNENDQNNQNETKEEKKKGSKKEKINQKAKQLGEKTQRALNHVQTFIVDCAVDTRQAIDKRRNKNQLPQYDLPSDYTHSETFEKKTFVVEQKEATQIDDETYQENANNMKKKPLPQIPQPK